MGPTRHSQLKPKVWKHSRFSETKVLIVPCQKHQTLLFRTRLNRPKAGTRRLTGSGVWLGPLPHFEVSVQAEREQHNGGLVGAAGANLANQGIMGGHDGGGQQKNWS